MNRFLSKPRSAVALVLVLAASAVTSVLFVPAATADPPLKVCASGCPYSSIAAAFAAAPSGARIIVAAGTYQDTLDIDKNVTLQGAGAASTTLAAPAPTSAFGGATVVVVEPNVKVTVRGMTITGGSIYFPTCTTCSGGGGFRNSGDLTLVADVVDGNVAGPPLGGAGGGIYNTSSGTLTVIGTTISHNSTAESGLGGGIYNLGSAVIADSQIVDNSSSFSAAIANAGTMVLRGTTVSGNAGGGFAMGPITVGNSGMLVARDSSFTDNRVIFFGVGGAIYTTGTTTLYGCTVARNHATRGGGIFNAGVTTLNDSTVTGNSTTNPAPGHGGGIYNLEGHWSLTLNDSVVSGNIGGDIDVGPFPSIDMP
jgi:fibronectin-binding autotransporter adhesin